MTNHPILLDRHASVSMVKILVNMVNHHLTHFFWLMTTTVAAFDFDGTITYRDSLLPFLFFCKGSYTTAWRLSTLAPYLAMDVLRGADRQVMKERVLTRFFGGESVDLLRQWGKRFASESLPSHCRPEAMERLRWHQGQGHRCILVSASIDLYLEPWARAVGFHDIITSRVLIDAQGFFAGHLAGKNCRGQEKVVRLEELLGPNKNYELYAYGDSKGDRELLAYADHPYMGEMPNV